MDVSHDVFEKASTTIFGEWSEMTLNYWRVVERYPKSNGVVGGSNHGCEIFPLLDEKHVKKNKNKKHTHTYTTTITMSRKISCIIG